LWKKLWSGCRPGFAISLKRGLKWLCHFEPAAGGIRPAAGQFAICEQLVKKICQIFGQTLDRKNLSTKFKRSGQQTVKLKTNSLWTYIIRF
jgi:phosphopantetheinyl transferase (holo-ACP synthase)